jgi:hypothetical protein
VGIVYDGNENHEGGWLIPTWKPNVALGNLAPVALAIGRREEFACLDVSLPAPTADIAQLTGRQV